MNEKQVFKMVPPSFLMVRKGTLHGKSILGIYTALGKELFILHKDWEIKTFEMIDGKNTIEDIIEKTLDSYPDVKEKHVIELIKELESYGVIYTGDKINLKKITKSGNYLDPDKAFLDYLRVTGLKNLEFPVTVRILLTLRCNANCVFCYLKAGEPYRKKTREEMSTDEIKTIIDEAVKNGVNILTLSGGEPFLRDDIIEIIEYATRRIPRVDVLTNGTLLADEKKVKSLADRVNKNSLIVQISLDGSTPSIHEKLRRGANFNEVIEGIKNTLKYDMTLYVNTVVTKINIHDLENIVSLVNKIGCKFISFSEFMPVGNGVSQVKNLLCPPSEYFNLKSNILPRLRKKYPNIIIAGKFIEPEFWDDKRKKEIRTPTYGSCAAYTTDITIGPDGRCLPCAWVAAYPEFYGKDVTESSISEVWHSDPSIEELRKIKVSGKCEKCEFNQLCYKGCFALKYALFGKIDIPDPKCWYKPGVPSSKKPPTDINYLFSE